MIGKLVPGIFLLLVVALSSEYLSSLVVVAGKHPLEASALAVMIGLAIRNSIGVSEKSKAGVAKGEKFLLWGIVLLGAGLDFAKVLSQGGMIISITLTTMLIGFFLIYYLGNKFKLSDRLALLLAAGTTICGTSAIAIVAPLIKSKEEETSYAIGTVALWGLVAILLYPLLGRAVHASDLGFGVFAGTAIHSTPQVVGAGFIYSDLAGQTATTVKLLRNCFMAPLALLVALYWTKDRDASTKALGRKNLARAFPWFLFGYLLMAILATYSVFPPKVVSLCTDLAKFLVIVAMSGIGLSTDLKAFRKVGFAPLLVGLIGAIILAGISALLITFLL